MADDDATKPVAEATTPVLAAGGIVAKNAGMALVADDASEQEMVVMPAPEPAPEPATQWNRHHVKKLEAECNQLAAAMIQTGYTLNVAALMDAGQAYAACKLLVANGLATEDEVNGECLSWVRGRLMAALQQAEVSRLQQAQAGRGLSVARKPGLIVAKH